MKLEVLKEDGKKSGKSKDLPAAVFGIEPHDHAIWLDVRSTRANQRQGTHETKTRSMARGGGRKPFRQKGTGRARQGTIRAPHHVGGGRVFGPHPRKYVVGINKKMKRLARKSALSYRARDKAILLVEDFSYDEPKTSRFEKFLGSLDLENKNILLLTAKNESNINLSTRNLFQVEVRESATFSTYDILRAQTVVVQEGALKNINEVLG